MKSHFRPLKYLDTSNKVTKKESFTTTDKTRVTIITLKLGKKIPSSK